MNDELTEFVVKYNKWQIAQIDVAQKSYERLFFSHIDELSKELELEILAVRDLDTLSRVKVNKLISNLVDIQNLRYEDAVSQYFKLSGHLADYVSVTESAAFNLKPVTKTIQAAYKTPVPASGMVLKDHMQNLVDYNNKRLSDKVRFAWANKTDAQELVKEIVGTKRLRYKDGLINDQKTKSKAALDTATQHVTNNAKGETYKKNNVFKYQLKAALDYSTTPLCRSLDSNVYTWGADDARVPPFHYYCRTVIVPYDDMVDDLLSGSTRASWSGEVSNSVTYDQWIKDNPMPDSWVEPARPKRRRKKVEEDGKE